MDLTLVCLRKLHGAVTQVHPSLQIFAEVRQNRGNYNIPPTLTNHLMPAFQQECSLSWDYKNWLLAQGRGRLSLEPACSFNSGCSLVCQGVGLLYLKCPHYLRSLFWINSLLSEILCVWKFFSTLSSSVQFSSVAQSCPTLCDPMNRSKPGLPVHHQVLEFTQTYVHRVGDAIQPSHPLSSPSPPAPNPS